MNIRLRTMNLIKKYSTTNPYKIAKQMGIYVVYLNLKETKGFYKKILKRKYIFINENLNEFERKLVCAHELGHAILHAKRKFEFLLETTNMYKQSKIEDEANEFASWLIFGDDDEMEYNQELEEAKIECINLLAIKNMLNIRKKRIRIRS